MNLFQSPAKREIEKQGIFTFSKSKNALFVKVFKEILKNSIFSICGEIILSYLSHRDVISITFSDFF